VNEGVENRVGNESVGVEEGVVGGVTEFVKESVTFRQDTVGVTETEDVACGARENLENVLVEVVLTKAL